MITDHVYTVYIVDSDEAVRDSLAALLNAEGFLTQAFASHQAFFDGYQPGGRACLLWDPHLPRQGGDDILMFLGDAAGRLPVIVMSGSSRNTKNRALRSGAAAFIEKPLDADELFCALQDIFT